MMFVYGCLKNTISSGGFSYRQDRAWALLFSFGPVPPALPLAQQAKNETKVSTEMTDCISSHLIFICF